MSAVPSALTHVSTLLDAERIAPVMRDALGIVVDARELRVDRVWPTADGLAVQWSWPAEAGGRTRLYVRSAGSAQAPEYPQARDGDVLSACVFVPQIEALLHTPDRDADMPQLVACLDGVAMAARLNEAGLNVDAARPVMVELLGYKPARRAAVAYRVSAESDRILAKIHRRGQLTTLCRRHERLSRSFAERAGERVGVPQPIGRIDDLNMVLFAEDGGRPARLVDPDDAHRAIEVLAVLHRLRVDGLPVHGPAEERLVVERWQALCERIVPGATSVAQPMLDIVEHRQGAIVDHPCATIHRDFYGAQVLVSPERTTLLDLDTLAIGYPAIDLANLLAHVLLDHSVTEHAATTGWSAVSAIIQDYEATAGPVDHGALEYYLISSLYRLGAVHMFRTVTGPCASMLWAAGNQLATRGLGGVLP